MRDDTKNQIDHGALSRSAQEEREFGAAVRLRDWVEDLLDGPARTEWAMTPGDLDNVFVGTFAKGTKTYRAALLLCDRGYGQQGAMLNRSLFEHTVVTWWLLLCVEDEGMGDGGATRPSGACPCAVRPRDRTPPRA